MTTLGQRIRGLFACLALLGLVVAFPAILIAIGFAPWDADLAELRRMLTRPDDGSLAFAAFAAVGWCAWAVVTGSVLLAAVAEVRRVPAPALPGLAMPQQFAAQLVGAAALLFMAAPTIAAALPSPPAYAVRCCCACVAYADGRRGGLGGVSSAGVCRTQVDGREADRHASTPSPGVTVCGGSPSGCSGTALASPNLSASTPTYSMDVRTSSRPEPSFACRSSSRANPRPSWLSPATRCRRSPSRSSETALGIRRSSRHRALPSSPTAPAWRIPT